MHVYCLMSVGGTITPQVSEVLLLNAVDMWDLRRLKQPIRARSYEGIIETDLEIIEFQGVPAVEFHAMVTIRGVPVVTQVTQANFLLRVDDLEGVELAQLGRLEAKVMGDPDMPFPFPPAPFPWNLPDPKENNNE